MFRLGEVVHGPLQLVLDGLDDLAVLCISLVVALSQGVALENSSLH
jgi:hypothetical protein